MDRDQDNENFLVKRREPFAFMLYLGIAGSSLLFLSIFLLFLRKEFQSPAFVVEVPDIMWLSTLVIFLSSVSIDFALKNIHNQDFVAFRRSLSISFLLGAVFIIFQSVGWVQMLNAKSSGLQVDTGTSFLFVLSVLHVLHILVGLIAFGFVLAKVFRNRDIADALVYSVNPPNVLNLKLLRKYWHFLFILWIIIFSFLVYHAL